MRVKVFLLTFGIPILFGLIIFSMFSTIEPFSKLFFGIVIIVGILIRILFTERRYVENFNVVKGRLQIQYFNSFLKAKTALLDVQEIMDFEIVRANWLLGYPAAINIKDKNGWKEFHIIDK